MVKKSARKDALKRRQHRMQASAAPSESRLEAALQRALLLKQHLVRWSEAPRFDRFLRTIARRRHGPGHSMSRVEEYMARHELLFQYPLRDGRMLVERFVDENPELSPWDQDLLRSWCTVIEGTFEVQRLEHGALECTELATGETYRVRSTNGVEVLNQWEPGSFLVGRIVPFGEEWLITGGAYQFPASHRAEVQALSLSAPRPRAPDRITLPFDLVVR